MLAAIAASAVDGDAAAAVMMGSQTASMNSSMAFSVVTSVRLTE
ncbi:hypothetical protein [Psychrobacter sp. JCM 18901]|nr:hypothetical protein [Psychrobacter sp. JCM 18901]